MNLSVLAKDKTQSICLVLFFALCQTIGTMCAVPDVSLADDLVQLVEEMDNMACPMDGTITCPPSLIASPERQIKNVLVVEVDPALALRAHPEVPTDVIY